MKPNKRKGSMNRVSKVMLNTMWLPVISLTASVSAHVSDAIAERDGAVIATLHAEGAQVYECRLDPDKISIGGSHPDMAISRAHCRAVRRRKIDRAALRRPELGSYRCKQCERQSDRQHARRKTGRHSLAQARRDRPSRQR